jgi:hypothetical protein
MTEGSFVGDLIRLIGKRRPDTGKWSRTRRSAQLSRNLELGWSHMASRPGNAQELFHKIAMEEPATAALAWGPVEAARFRDEEYVDSVLAPFLDMTSMPEGMDWLVEGWIRIANLPATQRVYSEHWFEEKVEPVIKMMKKRGWKDKRTLAAGVRLLTTSPTKFGWLKNHPSDNEVTARDEALARYGAKAKHLAERVEMVQTWPEFDGVIGEWPHPDDLRYGGGVARKVAAVAAGALLGYGLFKFFTR